MDRRIQEVVGILCHVNLQTGRQTFFRLTDYIQQVVDGFRGVGSCHLEDDTGYSLMTVYSIIKGIRQTSQLNSGNISQTEHFPIRQSLDNNILKFFSLLQTSFVTDGVLECLVSTFTELSRSRFNILFSQSIGNIRRHQFILRHNIRFQPNTHRIVQPHHIGITHTFYTLNFRNQVNFGVVFNKFNVIFVFRIIQ